MGATSAEQSHPVTASARRPAVLAAALFMAGIGLHRFVPHHPALWLLALAALLAIAWRAARVTTLSTMCTALALLIAGISAAQVEGFFYPRDHVSAFAGDEPRLAQLEMDLIARTVHRSGKEIDLQPREFQLLEFMMRHAGQSVTRTMLLEKVWEYHFDPQTNVIDVHISRLRSKIDKGFDKAMLQTVRGAGYRLEA